MSGLRLQLHGTMRAMWQDHISWSCPPLTDGRVRLYTCTGIIRVCAGKQLHTQYLTHRLVNLRIQAEERKRTVRDNHPAFGRK